VANLSYIARRVLREAFDAYANKTLEEFLENYSDEQKEEIRAWVVPSIAFTPSEVQVVSKNELREEHSPKEESKNWQIHKQWISDGPYSLPPNAIASISDSTREICTAINASGLTKKYGLVVGYVQSGKTANYTALISRAVDMGYTFIVVLSGLLNDLREQTQIRLMRDLMGVPNHALGDTELECIDTTEMIGFIQLTSIDSDFKAYTAERLPDLVQKQSGKPIIAVMKKNVLILEHLLDGLKRVGPKALASQKLLIIDDEADHATINTGGEGDEFADDNFSDDSDDEDDHDKNTDPTRTNRRIRQIINCFENSTYIGYTATPFANVLINKDIDDPIYGQSLYPRDFIISLPEPKGYFGAEKFFGGLDDPEQGTFHTIPVAEEEVDKAYQMDIDPDSTREANVPESLKNAMLDFILTGLVKEIRKKNDPKMNPHHTMLIHIQWRNDDQSKTKEAVKRLFDDWKVAAESRIRNDSTRNELQRKLKQKWEQDYDSSHESWSQILEELSIPEDENGWLSSVEIRMINSLNSEEKLDYDNHPNGLSVIAIGGNKLSRGLTLEGLTTSYFLRHTKMYDSLMQMGRWFGFRHGYEDLVRVHASAKLLSWFHWLVDVERHVRSDIARYSLRGMTPEELAVRIPLHSEMKIASSSKMKNAIRSISDYQGIQVQTIRLPVGDEARLLSNLSTTTAFLESLDGGSMYGSRMWGWRGVSATGIANFLESMDIDGPPDAVFDPIGIAKYLRKNHAEDEVFVGQPGGQILSLKQGPGKVPQNDPSWSFGTRYVARTQGFEILSGVRRGTNNLKVISDRGDVRLTEQLHPNGVCLLVYLIAPGSTPRNHMRMALPNHETPIVGVSIRFPSTEYERKFKVFAHSKGIKGD
jgi:hypothetical protein